MKAHTVSLPRKNAGREDEVNDHCEEFVSIDTKFSLLVLYVTYGDKLGEAACWYQGDGPRKEERVERSIGQARRSLLTSTRLLRLQRLSLNDDCNIVDEIPNYMNYTKIELYVYVDRWNPIDADHKI